MKQLSDNTNRLEKDLYPFLDHHFQPFLQHRRTHREINFLHKSKIDVELRLEFLFFLFIIYHSSYLNQLNKSIRLLNA